jgi:general secretion pathway protein D
MSVLAALPLALFLAVAGTLPQEPPKPDDETQKAQQTDEEQKKAQEEAEKAKSEASGRPVTQQPAQPAPVRPAVQPANPAPRGPAQAPRGGRVPPPAPVASTPTAQDPAQQGKVPFIQEVGDFYIINIDETEGVDLESLTKMCQVATGKNFVYDEATKQELANKKARMFGEKRVPKDDFYSFYQILMFIHGFTLTKVGPDHLAVYLVQTIQPVQGRGAGNLQNEPVYVDPDDLDQWADQVATKVITVLHLPHTDVRTIGNSLRQLMNDQTGSSILPVGTTNSVVLTGFASTVASHARILRLVDEEAAKDIGVQPLFEVIRLEFAAAEDLADILEQLLEASKRQQQQQRQANAQGATGQIQTAGGETKILTYPRTNSLLVMALPDDMVSIKELVARLDVEVVEPERTYHVYVLEHVKAKDLSEVLEDFIQGASRVQGQGARGGGANVQGAAQPGVGLSSRDNEVVVVPDETTNSLLIAASRRRYQEMEELIHRLDRRQEQVLIETALIELTGRDNLDLGVELGFADIPGSGTGGFGVTNFGLGSFVDTDNDGIPDIKVPNTNVGVTAGILDADDFSMPVLIAALRDRRDSNVLNIPSVLVNNNGSATVTTVDEQPTTTVTLGGVGGQTQENFNEYQKAGITMQISPSISASGYLRLDITLEVSNFLGVFQGSIPPPRITRTIQTSVSVPDGDTMVVGGIIVDNKDKGRTSVPLLGDLPIVGALFRRDTENKNVTTLYFFVTPHILRDQNFADLAEISYRLKLNAAEKIGADRVKLIDPAFGGAKDEVDLRGFEVPLYRSPRGGEVSPELIGQDPALQLQSLQPASPPPDGT